MIITPDVIRREFIGLQAAVTSSPHIGYLGISGEIIGETRNTFMIQQMEKMKTIVKDQAIFQFQFSEGTVVEIDGQLLVGKPEDRLKKQVKRLW
jgi:ribonuclease P protein subunit POP4